MFLSRLREQLLAVSAPRGGLLFVRWMFFFFKPSDRREMSPLESSCAVRVIDATLNDQLQT